MKLSAVVDPCFGQTCTLSHVTEMPVLSSLPRRQQKHHETCPPSLIYGANRGSPRRRSKSALALLVLLLSPNPISPRIGPKCELAGDSDEQLCGFFCRRRKVVPEGRSSEG